MKVRIQNGGWLAVVLTCCWLSLPVHAAVRYSITLIGPAEETLYGILGYGLNNYGDVVGDISGLPHNGPFLYTDSGGMQFIPNSPFTIRTYFGGINDAGEIVASGPGDVLLRYSVGVGYEQLGGGSSGHSVQDARPPRINGSGQIAFTRDVEVAGSFRPGAAIHTPGQGEQLLGFFNGNRTWANGINGQGQVVGGTMTESAQNRQGLLWNNGWTALPMREAFAINEDGLIAGVTDSLQPVVLKDGVLVTIPVTGVFESRLIMNNEGVVAGRSLFDGANFRPFIWSESEGTTYLHTLVDPASGWEFQGVSAINDAGQVLGWGRFENATRIFRLDPVPEPGIWALLGLGGIGFWLFRRRC